MDFPTVLGMVNETLPKWREKILKNAKLMTELMGKAYENCPYALALAKKAKNFQELVSILKKRTQKC